MSTSAGGLGDKLRRAILFTLLIAALAIGPISFSPDAVTAGHHSQSSDHQHSDADEHDHDAADHMLAHCGPISCNVFFTGPISAATADLLRSSLAHRFSITDSQARTLYMKRDPPVPRSELFPT